MEGSLIPRMPNRGQAHAEQIRAAVVKPHTQHSSNHEQHQRNDLLHAAEIALLGVITCTSSVLLHWLDLPLELLTWHWQCFWGTIDMLFSMRNLHCFAVLSSAGAASCFWFNLVSRAGYVGTFGPYVDELFCLGLGFRVEWIRRAFALQEEDLSYLERWADLCEALQQEQAPLSREQLCERLDSFPLEALRVILKHLGRESRTRARAAERQEQKAELVARLADVVEEAN